MRDEREARAREYYLLGRLLAGGYSTGCAAELLGEAVEIDPTLVAARVELGFVLGREEDYAGMLDAFREAVRIDERGVRSAVGEEPEELERLRQVLRPDPPADTEERAPYQSAMPVEFRQSGALVTLALEHVKAGGRDERAVAALESALRLDATGWYSTALLALTYLLLMEGGWTTPSDGEGSILWEAEPVLARLLFEGRERTPPVSH